MHKAILTANINKGLGCRGHSKIRKQLRGIQVFQQYSAKVVLNRTATGVVVHEQYALILRTSPRPPIFSSK